MIAPVVNCKDLTITDLTREIPLTEEKVEVREETIACRICLEPENHTKLINPCRCSGSVKYVHEECLKTWILSQNTDLDEAQCEICHTVFLMKYRIVSKLEPGLMCKEGIAHCVYSPLLLTVIGMLILIVYLLMIRYLDEDTSDKDKVYCIILVVACTIAAFVLIIFVVNALKDSCFVQKMDQWNILSENFHEIVDETVENDEFVYMRENKDLFTVPPLVLVKGRRVERPDIYPVNLTPVSEEGRFLIYRASTLNESRNSTTRNYIRTPILKKHHRHSLSEVISIDYTSSDQF